MTQFSLYRPLAGGGSGVFFDELRRDMDALLNRYGTGGASTAASHGVYPPVNLYETEDGFVLTAELPGVAPDDIHVTLEAATVTLHGERKIEHAEKDKDKASLHRRERQAGSFRRAFELPAAIDPDKVEAVHKNGVLMLRLPKTQEHRPRRISVRGS